MNGSWYEGYWAAVRQAKNLNAKRIEQLIRFETAVVQRTMRILSWHEGRLDGLKGELRRRSEPPPLVSIEIPASEYVGRRRREDRPA